MGSNHSLLEGEESQDDRDKDEEEEEGDIHSGQSDTTQIQTGDNLLGKKLFQQSPEVLPCHASSASPLKPQPSAPPSVKSWDPHNVLAPPPVFPASTNFSTGGDRTLLEVYLISHGECELNLRPELVGGRCDGVALTANGKRQARALAVFLNSQGVRFTAIHCSPLDRARSMAVAVAKEMNFSEERIQSSDALMEMSMGHWEGCHQSETYTPEILSLFKMCQPDFCAPSGESLRQVEFRMLQFLNGTLLGLSDEMRHHQNGSQGLRLKSTRSPTNSSRDGSSLPPPRLDINHRHRHGPLRKKSVKSRLQIVSNTGGDHDADDEMSPRVTNHQTDPFGLGFQNTSSSPLPSSMSSCIGFFTHSLPIKCLVTGLLECSPAISHKICIEDSSVTVLQHSWKTGWQIKRLNDTAHLRLL